MLYTLDQLKKSKFTKASHYLVVGNPVGHSLSPMMHNLALQHYGIEAEYHALQLETGKAGDFAAWCNRESFSGCNITIPFKEVFKQLVDEIDSSASQIGAINTIVKKTGKLIGYNTDVFGFISPITELEGEIEGGRAVVFGTGGASKAVKAGLIQLGVEEIVFVSRNPSAIEISNPSVLIKTVDYSQWQAYADEASIFVNSTPVGMYPNPDEIFIERKDAHLFEDKICYDLIYNPVTTSFLNLAENAGAVVVDGLEMFIQQGSRSFELWTGRPFPAGRVKEKLIRHFKGQ